MAFPFLVSVPLLHGPVTDSGLFLFPSMWALDGHWTSPPEVIHGSAKLSKHKLRSGHAWERRTLSWELSLDSPCIFPNQSPVLSGPGVQGHLLAFGSP